MKTKSSLLPGIWYLVYCLLVAVVMAAVAVHVYPLLVDAFAPLDSIALPAALHGLKLSSVLVGAFGISAVSAIPAIARALAPATKNIICRD